MVRKRHLAIETILLRSEMSDAYGNLIPQRWVPATKPAKYEQHIIVNWLAMEIPSRPSQADDLSGWRNREVYYYVKYEMPDWTADCAR